MFCVDNFGKDSQMSPHNFLYYTDNRCFGVSVFLAWIIMTTQDSVTGGRLYRLRWGCVISNKLETLTRPRAESCVSCDKSRVRYFPVDTILDIESLSRGSSLNLCNFPEYLPAGPGSGSRWSWYQYWLQFSVMIEMYLATENTELVTQAAWRTDGWWYNTVYTRQRCYWYRLEWNLAVVLTDQILWT